MPSLSWIDTGSFEQLLTRVEILSPASPAPGGETTRPTMGWSFTSTSHAETSRAELAASAPQQAATVPPPPAPAASAARLRTPFAPTSATFGEALHQLADWLEAELGPAGLFVADAEGLPLVARGEIAETPVLGSALIRAWRSLASSLGLPEVSPLAADLDEGKRLFVRPAVTPWSLLFLGLITAETPCREDFDSLNQALDTVVGLAS